MNIQYTNTIKKKDIDTYIVCISKKNKNNELDKLKKIFTINKFPQIFIKELIDKKENIYYSENYKIYFYYIDDSNKNNLDNDFYKLFGRIGKKVKEDNKNTFVFLYSDQSNLIKNQIYGFLLGNYIYDKLKTDGTGKKSKIMFYNPKKNMKNIIINSIKIVEVQNEVRSLINTPANILTSITYSKYIRKNIETNVRIKILEEKTLKKIGCNLILGVNSGSQYPAKMIILEYCHKDYQKEKPIAMIGKGVMFDSGGLNIKSGDFSDMKTDMTGSCIVYGVIQLLAHFKAKGKFIGILPLVENMVDAKSIRPGDVLMAYNKKTVEIIDTDAEGRLIMADALAYSINYKPQLCIDIATLTGQAATIFGNKSTVIMGNDHKEIREMIIQGEKNHERIWELPMWKEYVEMTKSKIADYKNYSYESRAGTIMAGAFLSNFVPNNTSWIHLDIAGVDFLKENTVNRFNGASSEILRTLFDYCNQFF